MTKDMNKGISDIQYNLLNLPRQMDIKSPVAEARNEYTYSAGGQKLKMEQKWNPNYSTAPVIGSAITASLLTMNKTTDYIGNMIYENGTLKRILIDGGYIEGGVYYYYLNDHQGNTRLVCNASGTVIQKNHYYPFGMTYAETPVAEQGKQPYKYNGKELDQMNGLNQYDYSARYYDPAIARFTTMDPMAEKYYSVSPYAYCNNNPANAIDPTGEDSYYTDNGQFIYTDNKKTDEIRIVNNYMVQLVSLASKSSGKLDVQKAFEKIKSVGIGDADLSAKAYSNIFTDVLSKMNDVDTKELFNGKASASVFDGGNLDSDLNPTFKDSYNTNIKEYTETASHQGVEGKSLVTGSIVSGGKKDNRYLFSTVSNVQNMLGAHELLGHGINGWGDRTKTHYKVYEFQMAHPSWSKTTPEYKDFMINRYHQYLNPKR